jgi:hypothetical protein
MKIQKIECLQLRAPQANAADCDGTVETAVIRVTADNGMHGLGETDAPPNAIAALLETPSAHIWSMSIRDLLLGENPLEVERLCDKVYEGTIYHARRGLGIMLMSAIDNALHDLRGKILGKPAYQLMGGVARQKITPYATLFPSMPQGRGWPDMRQACIALMNKAPDLIPDIVDYYYKRARPGDCFVNALTGAGYIHEDKYAENYPSEQQKQIRQDFLKLSSLYRQRIDAAILNTYAEMPSGLLESFAGMSGVQGVFANYLRTHEATLDNIVSEAAGKPVFRAVNGRATCLFKNLAYTPDSRRETEWFMIDEVRRWTPRPRPTFLYVSLANWLRRMDMAVKIAKGLGPEYVAVRPDQRVSLYRQSLGG